MNNKKSAAIVLIFVILFLVLVLGIGFFGAIPLIGNLNIYRNAFLQCNGITAKTGSFHQKIKSNDSFVDFKSF